MYQMNESSCRSCCEAKQGADWETWVRGGFAEPGYANASYQMADLSSQGIHVHIPPCMQVSEYCCVV